MPKDEKNFFDALHEESMKRPKYRAAYEALLAEEAAQQRLLEQLVKERKARKITQSQIAAKLGVTQAWISQLERSKYGIDFGTAYNYARCLDLDLVLEPAKPPKEIVEPRRLKKAS